MSKELATKMSPPFISVAIFMVGGILFYLLLLSLLPFFIEDIRGYELLPQNIGLVHLFLVGFVMSVIFGSLYQLLPVALEAPMFSKDFSYIQAFLHFISVSLFVFGFIWGHYELVRYGSLLLFISMMIFAINATLTLFKNRNNEVQTRYIIASIFFLVVGISIGFLLAFDYFYPFLGEYKSLLLSYHIISLLLGFIGFIVMGISIILVPMFMISHGFDKRAIESAYYPLLAAMAGMFIGLALDDIYIKSVSFGVIVIFMAIYLIQMYIVYKNRARKKSDSWSLHLILSFVGAIFSLGVAAWAPFFDAGAKIAFLSFLLLVLVPFINGHLYKIIPFLRWFEKFSPLVGKEKVPMLSEMIKEGLARYEGYISFVGAILLICGVAFFVDIFFYIGVLGLFAGALMLSYNIYYALRF